MGSVLLAIASLAAVVLGTNGLWQVLRAALRRAEPDTPFCRRCRYNLTGLQSARCPECGAALAKGVVIHGRAAVDWRGVQRGSVRLGCAAVLLSLWGSPAVLQLRWVDCRATSWFVSDLAHGAREVRIGAYQELRHRGLARLTPSQLDAVAHAALIDMCSGEITLEAEAAPTITAFAEARPLRVEEIQSAIQQRVDCSLHARARIPAGIGCFVSISASDEQASVNAPVKPFEFKLGRLRADGSEVMPRITDRLGSSRGLQCETTITFDTPGVHTIAAEVLVTGNWLRHEVSNCPILRQCSVEVLPADGREYTELDEPIREPTLRAALNPRRAQLLWPDGFVWPKVHLGIDVAFEVYARFDGRQEHWGYVLPWPNGSVAWLDIPDPNHVPDCADLVFVSTPEAARRTVDLTAFWKGELAFPRVPIHRTGGGPRVGGRWMGPPPPAGPIRWIPVSDFAISNGQVPDCP